MNNFLINFDNEELFYFINLLDNTMNDLDKKYNSLKDLKNEIEVFLSNNRGG